MKTVRPIDGDVIALYLVDEGQTKASKYGFKLGQTIKFSPSEVDKIIRERIPIIDAVPIVRCKDCKYNYANMIPSHSAECSLCVELPITDEFFCAKGEREESENENRER